MDANAQLTVPGSEINRTANGGLSVDAMTGQTSRLIEEHAAWPMLARLPVALAVSIPLRGLKVCNLLDLRCGQTIESAWAATEDVPLKVGVLQLCWGEFEVVEQKMALRLTRLA